MSSALAYRTEPGSIDPKHRRGLSHSIQLAGATVVLLAAPLAFGAVEPWAIFLLEASAALLLLCWGYRQWANRELTILPHPLYAPMMAFGALVIVQWLTGITAYRHALTLSWFSTWVTPCLPL